MPFKSKAQVKYLYAKHPDIAKKWRNQFGISSQLPNRVKKKKKVNV